MPKIVRILRSCSMKIFCKFPTINMLKLIFWLVIYMAKNLIWTTLKAIFSVFFNLFFCTLRFQIFKLLSLSQILAYPNKPYINGKIMYSAFRWCRHIKIEKWTLMTGFVVQGHIYEFHALWFQMCMLSKVLPSPEQSVLFPSTVSVMNILSHCFCISLNVKRITLIINSYPIHYSTIHIQNKIPHSDTK